ncbi:MAG: TonB-dependent receptor [Bacteroidetes bacterium]|nr:TonB-dependent receptor [Bacteroidota bacterium]MCW5894231.1 TonB-dependent receptor [Bacteroidota bacterium]
MPKSLFITFLVCALLVPVSRTNASPFDLPDDSKASADSTIKSYTFGEIVVTATRSPLSRVDSPSRVQLIAAEEIQSSLEKNLGELLVGKAGLLVRQYGSGASLQTVSFRGMSAEHSVVLLDGMPIGNVQTGLTDLSVIPLDNVESIELVRGGSSAQYGSDAMGGAINILTTPDVRSGFVRFDVATRSAGSQRAGVSGQVRLSDEWGIRAGSSVEYGRGDYDFAIVDGGRRVNATRSGSDFRSRQLFVVGDWRTEAETEASVMLSSYDAERGTPGPVLTIQNQGTARQTDEHIQASGVFRSRLSDQLRFSAGVNVQNAFEHYIDRYGIFKADNHYRNILTTAQANLHYSLLPNLVLHPGVEFGHATASGNALAQDQKRTHSAVYSGVEFHSNISPFRLSLYPSIRYDKYSTVGTAVSPKMGMNFRYAEESHSQAGFGAAIHATAGRNFRAPTFNELYYAGSGGRGNLDLNPEKSMSVDAGLTLQFALFGHHEIDVTYYSITTEDRIQWLPTSVATIWSPVNIGRTKSYGVEVEYRWSPLPGYLWLEGNYATIDAQKKFKSSPNDPAFDKQLIYVPLETGSAGVHAAIRTQHGIVPRVFLRVEANYVGIRYISEDNTQGLPSYLTMNGSCRLELNLFGLTAFVKYEMLNMLNESYEILPRYPMSLRNHSLTLSIQTDL